MEDIQETEGCPSVADVAKIWEVVTSDGGKRARVTLNNLTIHSRFLKDPGATGWAVADISVLAPVRNGKLMVPMGELLIMGPGPDTADAPQEEHSEEMLYMIQGMMEKLIRAHGRIRGAASKSRQKATGSLAKGVDDGPLRAYVGAFLHKNEDADPHEAERAFVAHVHETYQDIAYAGEKEQ